MRGVRQPGRDGFTLIEILLAIGILAVGITAVLFLFAMGVRSHRRSIDRTRSALLADAVVNQVQADLATSLPAYLDANQDGAPDNIAGATHADYPEFRYDVAFGKVAGYYGDVYKVTVTVYPDGTAATSPGAEAFQSLLRRKN